MSIGTHPTPSKCMAQYTGPTGGMPAQSGIANPFTVVVRSWLSAISMTLPW